MKYVCIAKFIVEIKERYNLQISLNERSKSVSLFL